ncbi:hypothetical protein Tco_0527354 [Tanacetum coccineum]
MGLKRNAYLITDDFDRRRDERSLAMLLRLVALSTSSPDLETLYVDRRELCLPLYHKMTLFPEYAKDGPNTTKVIHEYCPSFISSYRGDCHHTSLERVPEQCIAQKACDDGLKSSACPMACEGSVCYFEIFAERLQLVWKCSPLKPSRKSCRYSFPASLCSAHI